MKKMLLLLAAVLGLTVACCQLNYENTDPEGFAKLIAGPDVVVLDVRTAEEFNEGHIANALNIDVKADDFIKKARATLPKGKTIAVYCRAGRRSADAATRLGSKGYKVVNLYGGITAWKDNNMPVNTQQADSVSIVYFTRNLSAEGLIQAYEKVCGNIKGRIGVKLHTGEKNGPNIIPYQWVKALVEKDLPDATIIETNTYYKGDRYTTEQHRKTIEFNGWTFCPVDILDEEDTCTLPVRGGKWLERIAVGSHLVNYNSMVALTHFKGHTMGGFGGSNKNIGIGCADGRIGKAWIHTTPGQPNQWDIKEEEFMERMTESTKGTIDFFGHNVTYINVMRNMSVSCDCEGVGAAPVVTPNVGILSSTDILAVDKACVDIIYAMTEAEHSDMIKRIETRHGLRQLTYMKELGMGNDRYILIDMDNGGKHITAKDAAKGLKPFVKE